MNWATMSRAERDAAYNNSAHVPDSAALNDERHNASLRVREGGVLDVPYGARERQKWDLFPAPRADAPCLVFIHGGYWQRNSRESFSVLMDGVRAHGWAAALPGYTLCPGATMTDIVAEITMALDWLAEHGKAHGIAGTVVLSGWSAGGHLTAMALGHPLVTAGLSISGVFELGPIRDTYLNEKLSLTDDEIVKLSPLRLPPVAKPLAIAYGTAELLPLVLDSRHLHGMRCEQHLPGPMLPVPGANHFTVVDQLRRADGLLTRQLLLLAG